MIKVLNEESYEWLLNIDNLKSDYIMKFIESYVEEIFNVKIDITDYITEFDLDSSSLFGSIRKILEKSNDYKVSKIISDKKLYFNKDYDSINCKYIHQLSLIGDFEKYEYTLLVSIDNSLVNSLSDQELINLYKSDDEILLSIINDKKVV